MVPSGDDIHISSEMYKAIINEKDPLNPKVFKPLRDPVQTFLNNLISTARERKTTPAAR
jgi:hypothetical protein